jgi:hypothetical protein
MNIRTIALLVGALSCASAWCQAPQTESPVNSAPPIVADGRTPQAMRGEPTPSWDVDVALASHPDIHLFPGAGQGDGCREGTYKCAGPKHWECCSENQDCFTCDGTCHPKGTVKRGC